MACPCLSCELVDADKDNPQCAGCSDRMAYANSLDPENLVPHRYDFTDNRGGPQKQYQIAIKEHRDAIIDNILDFAHNWCRDKPYELNTIINTKDKRRQTVNRRSKLILAVYDGVEGALSSYIGAAFGMNQTTVCMVMRKQGR